METYFLKSEDILKFYNRIAEEYELFVPTRIKTPLKLKCDYGYELPSADYILARYSSVNNEDIVFNDYRIQEPTRVFFTQFKEEVCDYFSSAKEKEKERPFAICGIKQCDLFALKIQDYVFLEGPEQDELYKARREEALIIASDCPSFKEACFCRAFEINPYAEKGFDFNLSPLNNGYLLDVDSDKAVEIVKSIKAILTPATLGQISARAVKRESVVKHLDEHLSHHKIPKKDTLQDIVLTGYDSEIWKEEMQTCVECGGCVFICDTCHCFLLVDEKSADNAKRMRVWDGCLFNNFATVAGGANPLKRRYMRLRNRYLKKFDFFIENLGLQACCGCGRCIEVCPGRIDIRRILRKLYEQKYLPAH